MKVIINQPFGVGDVLFLSPLVANLDIEHAVWPVVDHYYWIKDYINIDNLTFVKSSEFDSTKYNDYVEVPLQHAHSLVPQAEDCMEAKYMLLEADPELWRTLSFTRNKEKEEKLKQYLNINPEDKFIFVNNNFAGPEYNYKIDIELQTDLKIIYQEYIDGFTLLDWCGVLEKAEEIHTVSTAIFFAIEALRLEKTPLHLYPRKPLDKDLSPIKTLINNKKWICHE
jgi:hypothetical protein